MAPIFPASNLVISVEIGNFNTLPRVLVIHSQMDKLKKQTVNSLLKIAADSSRDAYLSILEYPNSRIMSVKKSPAQLRMTRRRKNRLPATTLFLQPEVHENVPAAPGTYQQVQKRCYDFGLRSLSPF